MKRAIFFLPAALLLLGASFSNALAVEDVAGKCLTCHKETSPGIYEQWHASAHALNDVTCYDCHGADKSDSDAFLHQGVWIATLVTPQDCGMCHDQESEEFTNSHHAQAGKILSSNDAYMANVVAGTQAAVSGCESCHGSKIVIDPKSPDKLQLGSWPNEGIGRINPDGSLGACTACHSRHIFSRAQARQPETCGKCHLGPDHPQKEIYAESKHGITYATNKDKMNLKSDRWVVGEDYSAAPTCATCHSSATKTQPVTHDVGKRLSWTLRPAVSERTENWQKKRAAMQDVCTTCHSQTWVDGFYYQFDGLVNLYDNKFAIPAGKVMDMLHKNHSLKNPAAFGNKIEWTYWELWHHEGRRARMGASMMGPDYTWWHGMYEVAKHFYFKFIPEVRETGDKEAIAYIDSLLKNDPMHNWLYQSTGDLKEKIQSGQMRELYRKFYETKASSK